MVSSPTALVISQIVEYIFQIQGIANVGKERLDVFGDLGKSQNADMAKHTFHLGWGVL